MAEAISAHQKAVELTPTGHPDLPSQFSNLGNSYLSRFQHLGSLSDIAEAISAHQKAVELTPTGYPDLPSRFSNLGNSYLTHFQHLGSPSDIAEAISGHQKAVELTPTGHPDLPSQFSNLGNSYLTRFQHLGSLSDIAEAISAYQKAVELTPTGHPDLPCQFSNLGNSYLTRFQRLGSPSDIAEAISAHQKAIELTPSGHLYLAIYHCNLGKSFHLLSHLSDQHSNLQKSLLHYKSAASFDFASPSSRLNAATCWATLTSKHYLQSHETLLAFETAVSLLSLVAGPEHTVKRRHLLLQDMSDLPLQAAAAACSLGHIDKALEWLEQGRCLVWTQLDHLRTPIDDLVQHDPALALHFLDVSKNLECATARGDLSWPGMSLAEKIFLEKEAHAHLNLANEWNDLLNTIRTTVPGFHNFLKPPLCSALMQSLPDSGPAVVVNVHHTRCDAIALIAGLDGPLHIQLPRLSWDKANRYLQDFIIYLQEHQLHTREAKLGLLEDQQERRIGPQIKKGLVYDVLQGLWKDVVKPILEALAFHVSGLSLTSCSILTALTDF
jgi:tetratricopeptide (TPR) repeat protein